MKTQLQTLCCVTAAVLCLSLTTSKSVGQSFSDPTISSQDNFGSAVVMDGDVIVIGANRDDTEDSNVGQVHVFDRITGEISNTIDDPTETVQDNFGSALALSGNMLVIAAPQDDTQGLLVGQAHLYDVTTGMVVHTLDDPTVTDSDFFGQSVDMDGNNIVVGAPGDDTAGLGIGQAYLFDAVSGGLLHTFDDPTATAFDGFGQSVAIDGNIVVVGEPGDDTIGFGVGQVHLFAADTGQFLRTINDPNPTVSDAFGSAVSISGNMVVVGAPNDDSLDTDVGAAHLFAADTGALLHTLTCPNNTQTGRFGFSVDILGNSVVIGAPDMIVGGNRTGAAYLYDTNTGDFQIAFNNEDAGDGDEFGYSVSLSKSQVLIGSPSNDDQGEDVGLAMLCPLEAGEQDCVTILGDTNQDTVITLLDVADFVELLSSGGFQLEADMNRDGAVDLLDVGPFVELLSGL